MPKEITALDDRLYRYLLNNSLNEHPALLRLRKDTEKLPMSVLQIAPEQGQFMALLVRLMAARNILEVGTFTGYSALSMALAMADNGHIDTCDINREWTEIAQTHWRDAGVSERITLHLRPAMQTMEQMLDDGRDESFDLVFIDADKASYAAYYEASLRLLRTGGLVLLDNVLWKGKVADEQVNDPDTKALREVNTLIHNDERVDISMVPIGDGMTLARKR